MPSPPFLINGVACALNIEQFGERAFEETSGPEGKRASMKIKCANADLEALRIGLLGTVTFVGRTIKRLPPFQYPADSSGLMVCTSITDFFGQGYQTSQDTGLGFFDNVVMTANFEIPSYDPGGSSDLSHYPYVTTRMRTSTEVFAPPAGAFFFNGNPATPVGVAGPGFIRPHAEISATRHWIPYPFVQMILAAQGSVNTMPMVFGDYTFSAGLILFVNADVEPTSDPATGLRTFDVTLHMLGNYQENAANPRGWNFFIDNDGNYTIVRTAGVDGATPYGGRDLIKLFGDTF
jgi:hypothetical protein